MMIVDRKFSGSLSHNIDDYPEGIVVVIDKPYRWTSADVIRKVKFAACRHFGKKNLKVGHAGTLDPLASGVLIVCIGAACKQAQSIQASSKQYLAGVCFQAVTASYDREKEVVLCPGPDNGAITEVSIASVLPSMIGAQDQVAPLFSAKQVDGVRAYELARKLYARGESLNESAENLLNIGHIEITSLKLEDFSITDESLNECIKESSPASSRINVCEVPEGLPHAMIRIDCSKGTYIRSFARDLGEKLGTGAFLTSLCRKRCGEFLIENALEINSVLDLLLYSFTQPLE